jgi:HAD superfamily hydrolase (TIGR01509 family)
LKALILDLDGTLIDSHVAHTKSYVNALKGRDLVIDKTKIINLFGMTAENILKTLFPKLTKRDIDQIVNDKRERYLKLIKLIKAQPCADKFIKSMSNKFILAIASSSSMIEIKRLLDQFGWTNHFKLLMSSYDVPKPKPAPDLLIAVAKELDLKISDCLFVGDSLFDALSARSAGMTFKGVETGSFTKKDFLNKGFNSYSNLCSLLKALT